MFEKVPYEYPRKFYPAGFKVTTWQDMEPYFKELESAPLDNLRQLEEWILKRGELDSIISEEGSRRYIAMTVDTTDKDSEKSYIEFVQEISPPLQEASNRLDKKIVACEHSTELDRTRYQVYVRSVKNSVKLFREENIPISVELKQMGQTYQKICGGMTVIFEGREQTLQEMGKYLQMTDRTIREGAWRKVSETVLEHRNELEVLFDEMVKRRNRVASNAGFENFRDYCHQSSERFDYTPEDCLNFDAAIEKVVVPRAREIMTRRSELMKLDRLRPWDTAVDPLNRPPLEPFKKVDDLIGGVTEIFKRMDGEILESWKNLERFGLLDLESRKGKAPGGYQSSLDEARLPFIFMNAVGLNRDVMTLLHEAGHAIHSLLSRDEPIPDYRHAPLEFAEVASMGMELLAIERLEVFYEEQDHRRAMRDQLEDVVLFFPWMACVDSFQHWIYLNPQATPGERTQYWLELRDRYGLGVDYSGLEEARETSWLRQLHIFLSPFYYIEYGIAQLGALQVWERSRTDPAAAISDYKEGLRLGGSRPLPDLFKAAGIELNFSEDILRRLIDLVCETLDTLHSER